MEAETEVMSAKVSLGLPEIERDKEGSPPMSCGGNRLCHALTLDFKLPEVCNNTFLFL